MTSLAAEGQDLYFTGDSRVGRLAIATGDGLVDYETSESNPRSIAVAGTAIYWVADGAIKKRMR